MGQEIYYISLIILFINFILFFYIEKLSKISGIIDKPDQKLKIHKYSISNFGGIFFFLSFLIYFVFLSLSYVYEVNFPNKSTLLIFLISSTLIYLLGIFDDKYNVNYITKFIIFAIILIFLVSSDNQLKIEYLRFTFTDKQFHLGNYSIIFSVFCIIVFINAFNLFDGINLQCGFYYLILSLSLFFITKSTFFLLMIIPTIFFLILNFKNKVFLGDNGTLLLSFFISYFVIKFYNFKIISSDQIFILMLLPGIDMLRLFFKRFLNRQNPFKGDRNHLHHYLSTKYGIYISNVIIQSLILIPIILHFRFNLETPILIILSIFVYSMLIYFHKYKNEK